MQYISNIALFIFINFIDASSSAGIPPNQRATSEDDAVNLFYQYDYNPCADSIVPCNSSFQSILRNYQEHSNLNASGKLDEATVQPMNSPLFRNTDKSVTHLKAAVASSRPRKWSRLSLTYSIHGYPTQISQNRTEDIIREAFNAWLDYTPLNIKQTCSTCKSDFVIDFLSGNHGDGAKFDGVGGILAHAFFPEDGRIHFDKDEIWTERLDGFGKNLYYVAVHNIGHALGLHHAFNEESIMYPIYRVMPKSSILPQPDRDAIQQLYGNKQSSLTTPATTESITTKKIITPTTPATVPGGQSHPRCRRFPDAAFKHPDGTLHTFDGRVLWRYSLDQQKWERDLPSYRQYSRLPKKLAAGVYDSQKKQIVFFTNADVYYYDVDDQNRVKYLTQQRLPRSLQNSIVGAIYYIDQVYVITPKSMHLFELDNAYELSDGRALSEEFLGFTGTVKTAFSYGDLQLFFTTDRLVHIWSERLDTWQTSGKPMESNWFACSGAQTQST